MSAFKNPYQVNIKKIRDGYHVSAKVVSWYGDRYMPLFERMHRELLKAEAAYDLKTLALTVSGKNST